MLLVDLLSWWYTRGWGWVAQQLFVVRSFRILHFFSIADMLKTLFAPFRQDTTDTKRAPFGVKLQAFGGNIISRIFGFIIRSLLIVIGVAVLTLNGIVSVAAVALWPLVPLAPIVAVALLILEVGSV